MTHSITMCFLFCFFREVQAVGTQRLQPSSDGC